MQFPLPAISSVSHKAWVNQVLESSAVSTLWITNRIEQIDRPSAATVKKAPN